MIGRHRGAVSDVHTRGLDALVIHEPPRAESLGAVVDRARVHLQHLLLSLVRQVVEFGRRRGLVRCPHLDEVRIQSRDEDRLDEPGVVRVAIRVEPNRVIRRRSPAPTPAPRVERPTLSRLGADRGRRREGGGVDAGGAAGRGYGFHPSRPSSAAIFRLAVGPEEPRLVEQLSELSPEVRDAL